MPWKGEGRGKSSGGLLSSEDALSLAMKVCQSRREVRDWEVFLEEEDRLVIEVREAEVESISSARVQGLAVRVWARGSVGFSYTNRLLARAVSQAVDQALAAALLLPADPWAKLPEPERMNFPELPIFDATLPAIPKEEKIDRAREVERAALTQDRRIKRTRQAAYEEKMKRTWVWNSRGVRANDQSTLLSLGVEAVAEDKGEAQSFFELETSHFYDKLNPSRVGERAGQIAAKLLGGRGVESSQRAVVFSAKAAADFISLLVPAVCGDAVEKGRSFLAQQRGKVVASPVLSVVDDATWPEGPEAFPFDDEGTVAGRTEVIRKGRLENFLYNLYYGRKSGSGSTGNGIKPEFYLPPAVTATNFFILPGVKTEEELIREVEKGLWVVELFGLHTADPVSGEFSLGANGFLIRRGKVGRPVRGMVIAGTVGESLGRIAEVGDQIKFSEGAGAPALLVEEIDVCSSEKKGR